MDADHSCTSISSKWPRNGIADVSSLSMLCIVVDSAMTLLWTVNAG